MADIAAAKAHRVVGQIVGRANSSAEPPGIALLLIEPNALAFPYRQAFGAVALTDTANAFGDFVKRSLQLDLAPAPVGFPKRLQDSFWVIGHVDCGAGLVADAASVSRVIRKSVDIHCPTRTVALDSDGTPISTHAAQSRDETGLAAGFVHFIVTYFPRVNPTPSKGAIYQS
jgi:hypothetical protein